MLKSINENESRFRALKVSLVGKMFLVYFVTDSNNFSNKDSYSYEIPQNTLIFYLIESF